MGQLHLPSNSKHRYGWVRWLIVGVIVLLTLMYLGIKANGLLMLPDAFQITVDILFFIVFAVLAYLGINRILHLIAKREELEDRLAEAERMLAEAYQGHKEIFRISQLFAEATDQEEIIELILNTSMDMLKAEGVSFVPLDERAQPLPAMSRGDMPFPMADAWIEYLASPEVRQKCAMCSNQEELTLSCPLLQGSFLDTMGVYCLSLRRGDQDYGVLNLYLPKHENIDQNVKIALRTLIDEATTALEGVRLRKRAFLTLRQLQSGRETTDLDRMLSELLQNLQDTLDVDYAQAAIWDWVSNRYQHQVAVGDLPDNSLTLIDGILLSVISTGEPVNLGKVTGDISSPTGVRALLSVPMMVQDQPVIGAILVANRRAKPFNNRQLSILQTIAGQAALIAQNVDLLAQLEYRTLIDERARLAREIHDGLAQTLGFLKLKTAQALNYHDRGEDEQLRSTLETCHGVLSDAYQEARQAIDGLRVSSAEGGLSEWLQLTASDFQEYSGIDISVDADEIKTVLPSEVQAQLIRIVQEALSNVRKHALAGKVDLSFIETRDDVILEIRDDGVGFLAEDVPEASQYGLRGMRERADLIGADFQVISQPGIGTTVRVRLPLSVREGKR